jgi:two-component system, NtrC family, nitrogen regulation response regulator NtrX
VPTLQERRDDIGELAAFFLAQLAEKNRVAAKTLTPKAVGLLQNYSWPGNVRELKNLLERLDISVKNNLIDATDVPAPYDTHLAGYTASVAAIFEPDSFEAARQLFETEFVRRKLIENNQNIAKTAKQTGIDKSLVQKIAKKLAA